MYYLMNKDAVAASFHKENSRWMLLRQDAELPLGRFEINTWLEDRKAYKHNRHLKRLMIDCGCETTEGFIKITHAASINDSFWIKRMSAGMISLFTEMISTPRFQNWHSRAWDYMAYS